MLPEIRKSLGAFYTPPDIAEFLTNWAIRSGSDTALDPSAGDGVFLRAARARVIELGGEAATRVRGIELSSETFQSTKLALSGSKDRPTLFEGDFFDQSPETFGKVTAIIGNPPFIRYQKFSGETRQKALRRAVEAGVTLSELCSSWAPFLVHATRFVEPEGRMAVVAPAELVHAVYAKPVVRYLTESFGRVQLLVFEKRLFSDLSEDTVLVLAEGRGQKPEPLVIHALQDASSLQGWRPIGSSDGEASSAWSRGVARFVEYFVPPPTRDLYRELRSASGVVTKLGDVATVGIGYVTGDNNFFHLSSAESKALGISNRFLRPAVRNARGITGLTFTKRDWQAQQEQRARNLLLCISARERNLPGSLSNYLSKGIKAGISKGYKCRNRDPWFAVPHVHVGDAFLSYMSTSHPKLFLNKAKVVAPNTLHVVRLSKAASVASSTLAVGWCSSLTNLSCEIEGHSMGGGMLKMEPRESARVLVPILPQASVELEPFDQMARKSGVGAVQKEVDVLVSKALGLSRADVRRLADASVTLRERRTKR